jgi:hypothetical protein
LTVHLQKLLPAMMNRLLMAQTSFFICIAIVLPLLNE